MEAEELGASLLSATAAVAEKELPAAGDLEGLRGQVSQFVSWWTIDVKPKKDDEAEEHR